METVEYIFKKYNLEENSKLPIILHGGRRGKGLALLFKELEFKIGAEIGVETGRYAKTLCEIIPGLKLYGIDSWVSYKNYREHVSQEEQEGFYKDAKKRLAPYNCTLISGFSTEVVKGFEDESLDFVYIDGNHDFQHVTNDIAEWSKKVRKGGIIAGHDFVRLGGIKGEYIHVKDVVQAWAYSHNIKPWFVVKGDKCPSWFWIRK